MKLYIGVTNNNELYYIEWDKVRNEQQKSFSLCGGTYGDPKTEEEGEAEARERLKTSDYWDEIGFIDHKSFLTQFIDFNEVADYVLNTDGWEMTNGEYSHFGEYKNEEIYLNSLSGGQHQEKDLKELWITKEEFNKINKLWDSEHLKQLKPSTFKFMSSIFEKYKALCSDEEALNKYLDFLKWRQ